jgi:hypothetical protein
VVVDVHKAFRSSLDLALREVEAVAAHAARWEGLDPAALVRYFEALDFDLGPRQLEGLAAFARKAALRGEAPPFAGVEGLIQNRLPIGRPWPPDGQPFSDQRPKMG